MLALTNRSRAAHGVPRLKLNSHLSDVAKRHSRSMASQGTLFHTANVPHELRHYHWSTWGENVGMTSGTLGDLQDAFMKSPVHRENILNRKFTHVGIGVARAGGAYWVTVVFYG
ncbi:MAG: CAP domain-containing protein [Actinomycetota bacterium]|nr:CAP domain-containing protein [Actinomycetota bacterium]